MCNFFSCIATKNGKVFFSEDDSHETIIDRLGINDNGENLVRIEYSENILREYEYHLDTQDIPEWYERAAGKINLTAEQIFQKVKPAWENYEKIEAPARENYEKIRESAWENYEKIRASARENYEKIRASAWENYEKIEAPARENYRKKLTKIIGYI